MKRHPDEHVYFLKPVGMDGPIKIGWSRSPPIRLLELAGWSPFPLEMIGSVPGEFADEQYLHGCFASLHSHREWFHSTPALREIISKIIAGGSVSSIHSIIAPSGSLKRKQRKPRSPEWRVYWRYDCRIRGGLRKLWARTSTEITHYSAPEDVDVIVRAIYRGKRMPSDIERARLDDYIQNIQLQSVAEVIPVIKSTPAKGIAA